MSTRLVSFGSDSISWSCLDADYGKAKITRLRKVFRESISGKLSIFRESTLVPTRIRDQPTIRRLGLHYLDAWDEIVCEYRERQLSEASDGLLAISGIASDFSSSMQLFQSRSFDPEMPGDAVTKPCIPLYLAGLWRSECLPLQLLWRPRLPCKRPNPSSSLYVAPS